MPVAESGFDRGHRTGAPASVEDRLDTVLVGDQVGGEPLAAAQPRAGLEGELPGKHGVPGKQFEPATRLTERPGEIREPLAARGAGQGTAGAGEVEFEYERTDNHASQCSRQCLMELPGELTGIEGRHIASGCHLPQPGCQPGPGSLKAGPDEHREGQRRLAGDVWLACASRAGGSGHRVSEFCRPFRLRKPPGQGVIRLGKQGQQL